MSDQPKYEDGYRDGYKAGYDVGVGDGRAQGYSDAKYRAHRAVNAAGLSSADERKARTSVTEIVGKQA